MFITTNYTRTIVALLALAALPVTADTDPKLETVSLYLNVEKNGSLVSGLTEQNFRLFEDGKAQQFRLEKPEEPASVAILVEYSRSSGYFIDDIGAAMSGFLKYAVEGQWYALATFSHTLEINQDFTQQPARLTEAFSQLGPASWSEIDTYEAVHEMLDKLGRLPGRKILILVGCGIDTFSEHTLDDVKKKVEAENVTVFVAGVGSAFRTVYDAYLDSSARINIIQAQAFLRMLSDKSGGFAWFPANVNTFPDVMQGIMQSISSQYRLVYDTRVRGSGKFHKLKVEAFSVANDKRENFNVLVREGWR